MSDWQEAEKVYGKHCVYIVWKKPGGVFSSTKYYVYDRDTNKMVAGSFDSLADAVAWAQNEAKR
jgi:hypothetical protein